MQRRTRLGLVAGAIAVAAAAGGPAAVSATSGDDQEAPITGDALRRASEAALAHTGGGTVTDTEVGDEDSYYEVEVTLGDGRQFDVQLDESFAVVSADEDHEGEADEAPAAS